MAHRGNYLDLDPTYRDSFGRPMLRMTFDFTDNELKMSDYLVDKAAEIGQAMERREHGQEELPHRLLERGALPDHAQHRRHDHGRQPEQQRRQQVLCRAGTCPTCSLPAPVPFRRTPATTRPARWRPSTYLAADAIKNAVPEEARPAGAGLSAMRRSIARRIAAVVVGRWRVLRLWPASPRRQMPRRLHPDDAADTPTRC